MASKKSKNNNQLGEAVREVPTPIVVPDGTPSDSDTEVVFEVESPSVQVQDIDPVDVEVLPADEVVDDLLDVEEVLPPAAALPVLEPLEKASGRAIVPYDALTAYLNEIRRFPKLNREEEHELALQYHTTKDVEAAYRLISSNLWLVVKLARDYERAARSVLDLIQEGNIGLMEAVKNFDPFRNVRFPSYAVWWIKAYIVRYVIANWRLVKIGTTQAQRKLFFNLKKEKDRLEREGFYPAPKLLAEKLDVKESEVVEMEQRLSGGDVSVDTPIDGDSDSNLLSVLPSSQATAEDIVGSQQIREMLSQGFRDFAETLNSKERVIFEERMLGEDKVTLQDVAEKLKVSRERIRQIENRIRDKLKLFLKDKLGSVTEEIDL